MERVKHRYALNKLELLVDSFALNREERKNFDKFLCLDCGEELIAVLGEEVSKHFRHKNNSECKGETYLHQLGKHTFLETYNNCLLNNVPYWIEYSANEICTACDEDCDRGNLVQKFDLTKYYNSAMLEQDKDSKFTPDVLLSKAEEKLYIEIVVSHKCTQVKISTGIKIIEIYIEDEDSIAVIKDCKLTAKSSHVIFHNFRTVIKKNYCNGECSLPKTVLILDPDGCFHIDKLTRMEIDHCHSQVLLEDDSLDKLQKVFEDYVWNSGFNNCLVCTNKGSIKCPHIYELLIDTKENERNLVYFVDRSSFFAYNCDNFKSFYFDNQLVNCGKVTSITVIYIYVTNELFREDNQKFCVHKIKSYSNRKATYNSADDENFVKMHGGSEAELKRRVSRMFGVDKDLIKIKEHSLDWEDPNLMSMVDSLRLLAKAPTEGKMQTLIDLYTVWPSIDRAVANLKFTDNIAYEEILGYVAGYKDFKIGDRVSVRGTNIEGTIDGWEKNRQRGWLKLDDGDLSDNIDVKLFLRVPN